MPSVLITGAGRGLGLEFARQYAADGWRVHACARRPEQAPGLKALAGEVTAHALDVRDAGQIAALKSALAGEAIDLLVNNAGIYGPRGQSIPDTSDADWLEVLHVNALAPLRVATALADNVAQSRLKLMAYITSLLGSIARASTGGPAYRMSKAALNAGVRYLSLELAGSGIVAVLLHPGWVRTDMGGPGGQLDPETSISGMRKVIAGLKPADNGRFLGYDGAESRGKEQSPMSLSEAQTMVRDTARAFARERLAPHAAEWDREARFPGDAIAEMGRLGFMGMLLPEEWGGAGAGPVSYALALEEIAAGDGSCAGIMSVHNSVGTMPIFRFGSAEQKQRFLPRMASGEWLGAFCLTEPQAGSDAANLKTRARREGNHYVLSGTKQFITSGSTAKVAIVFAVTDPARGKKGISAFIVPTDTPGYQVARKEEKMGQRASDTCQIVFADCRLTPDLLLGEEGEGYRIALANLEGGRIGIAAQALGMARAAFEAALAYAKERQSFGKPLIGHQAVAFRLAAMATEIEAARQLVLHAADLRERGEPCLKEASMAKLFSSEMAERVSSDAIQIHGGYGYLRDFPVERIYRDVRVTKIYEGTSDVQHMVIARELAKE